jgi:osmoprotectant transport system substrate-binding protein
MVVEAAPVAARTTAEGVVVGADETTEQLLLGQMFLFLLEDAGIPATDRTGRAGGPHARSALEEGEIDLYPGLTGTALMEYHAVPAEALPTDGERSYALAQSLDQPRGFIWLSRGFFNHAPILLASPFFREQGILTLEDLAIYMKENDAPFHLCAPQAFIKESLPGLESLYGFRFKPENLQETESEAGYKGLHSGECQIVVGTATDGRVAAWDLYHLKDSLNYFSVDLLAPVARQSVLTQYPELETALTGLSEYLDEATMSRLNALVELGLDGEPATGDETTISEVASAFLCQNNLLAGCANGALSALTAPFSLTVPLTLPAFPLFPNYSSTGDERDTSVPATATLTTTGTLTAPITTTSSTPVLVSSSAQTPSLRVIISTPEANGVNARRDPSTQADILQLLPANTLVPAIGRTSDNAWLQVILPDGAVAWVFTEAMVHRPEAIEQLPILTAF